MVRFMAMGILCELTAFLATAAPPQAPMPPQAPPVGRYGVCVCGPACDCGGPVNCGCGQDTRAVVRTNEGRLIRWTGAAWVFADEKAPTVGGNPWDPGSWGGGPSPGHWYGYTPTTYSPFGTGAGGCANGQCQPQQPRGGFFRR